MVHVAWVSLPLTYVFQLVIAENIQTHWQVPDGTRADFTETLYNGDTVELQWTGWDSIWTDGSIDTAIANLYVASWNFNVSEYSRILSSSIDVSISGGYKWKIDISADALKNNSEYGLFFVNTNEFYYDGVTTIPSMGFSIKEKPKSSAAATPTRSTTTPTPLTTRTSTNGASSGSTSDSNGLNRKESAGIGAGVGVVGTAIVVGLGYLLIRRRKASSSETAQNPTAYQPTPTRFELESGQELVQASVEKLSEPDPPNNGNYRKSEPQEMFTPPVELPSQPFGR